MATLTVTTTDDVTDGTDGVLSLREALSLANAAADADTIEFAASIQGQPLTLVDGQLTATTDVTIDGGAGVTIAGDQPSRVLEIGGTGTDVVLDHLTITGGRTAGDTEFGGGILARSGTTLTLSDSTLSGNGTVGGAAFGGGLCSFGDVTLTNSTVSGNFTTGFAYGGGIFAVNVTLTNSTVSDNSTAGGAAGGGMWVSDRLTMTDCTVSGNSAAGPGGRWWRPLHSRRRRGHDRQHHRRRQYRSRWRSGHLRRDHLQQRPQPVRQHCRRQHRGRPRERLWFRDL
jgi:hypothetical protein